MPLKSPRKSKYSARDMHAAQVCMHHCMVILDSSSDARHVRTASMHGLPSTPHVVVSAVLLQSVCLCTLVPKALRYERWTRCHQSHLASPNTARDLHAAHVHAALHGDGICDSLSDARHVRAA